MNIPSAIVTSRAEKRYQVLLAMFSWVPIMHRGGWHGEHRRDDARSPAPALLGAAKAAAPVQGRILEHRNPEIIVFHWFYKGLTCYRGNVSILCFTNVFA